jgi:hypothetical protein
MKKVFILLLSVSFINAIIAQETTNTAPPKKVVAAHPSDHLLIQFGSDSWINKPDEAKTNGGRHFNFYLMLDKPFKTNPKFSVAYGLGIGSSNIYFDKTVDIKGSVAGVGTDKISFEDVTKKEHYNKFKLTEIFLELPVELRYTFNPENSGKSWKIAMGAKVGLLIKAYTKGKDLLNESGASIYGPSYIQKEFSNKLFNSTRLTFTSRIGYGNFSLTGAYTVTPVAKAGAATKDFNTLSIGLTLSGL